MNEKWFNLFLKKRAAPAGVLIEASKDNAVTERSPQWDASIVLTANRAYEMNNFKLFIPACGLVKQINHSKMLFYHSIERL